MWAELGGWVDVGAPPGMPALTPEMAKMVSDGHGLGGTCVCGSIEVQAALVSE